MTMIKKDGHWVTVAGGQRMWVGTKAQLDAALAAGELEDGTAIMVTDDYMEPITYSTIEQLTGDTWIDGKPIYRIVVDNCAFPEEQDIVQDNFVTASGITYLTTLNIDNIVNAKFFSKRIDGSNVQSLPRTWNNQSIPDPETGESHPIQVWITADINIDKGGSEQYVAFHSNRKMYNNSTFKGVAIIEYTKTTD